jgi:type IV pilus assembly protein PilV
MKTTRGVSLLEVLIAVVVLAVGLLGIARLQTQTLKLNHSAAQRSQAVMLAYYIMDAMRVNRAAAAAGAYNTGSTSNPTCSAPTASGSLASQDLADWFARLKENLGDASTTCAMINCDANDPPRCTVRIFWDDSRAGGEANQSIEITSQL